METLPPQPYILIVEDAHFLAKALDLKMRSEGYITVVARDAKDALDHLQDAPARLVLLDIMLPKGSGLDVLKAIRGNETWKDVPVLIGSNLGQEQDIKVAMERGANEYFVKADTPISLIVSKVREYLQKED